MAAKRLLIAYAHPDDESFGLGGLIARYVDEGIDVDLICATNGECGTVKPEMLNGYASVAELRLAELDCAAEKLGLRRVYKLGYRDSGMMGSETAQHPDCLWQADPAQVTRDVVKVMREVRPQVVITFNRYGGYGHPDHIAIQRAATEAFKLSGDPTYDTDGQTPYAPQKLYYSSIPRRQIQLGIMMLRLRRQDPRRIGKNRDIDVVAILENADQTHARIDISQYHDAWHDASQCHASQLGGGSINPVPMRLRKWLMPYQEFTRVHPTPNGSRERDLFAGVLSDEAMTEAAQ